MLSTSLASSLEVVFGAGLVGGLLAFIVLQPGGKERLESWLARLDSATWLQQPTGMGDVLAELAQSPVAIGIVLVVVSMVVPLIEEGIKTIGVAIMAHRHPTRSQAYLWGLAGGAGFALVEGLLNGVTGLDAWTFVVLGRTGATIMHCFTGALMGLAWYYALVRRRWNSSLGLAMLSVSLHGLWNALSIGVSILSLPTPAGGDSFLGPELSNLGMMLGLMLLGALTVGAVVALIILAKVLGRADEETQGEAPPEGTAVAA
jgi:RsiW-degrading membrane proteinase PrsW (M82 family)